MKLCRSVFALPLFCFVMVLFSAPSFAQTVSSIDLDSVDHFELVHRALLLVEDEQTLLENNHFVVSDNDAWERFVNAYAWIYWKDLPVLITTDSMLHALHQSYADLLIDLERGIMQSELETFLGETLAELQDNPPATTDPEYLEAHHDVIAYLQVAQTLLRGNIPSDYEPIDTLVIMWHNAAVAANNRITIDLFGELPEKHKREVDMTLFTPRGHYPSNGLSNYFRAMTWLGQIDFRFTMEDFNRTTQEFEMTVYPDQIAAAHILHSAIEDAGQRERWQMMNNILNLLAGESDNTTLDDFDQFIADAELSEPADLFTADVDILTTLFQTNDYGKQRITGQIVGYDRALSDSENDETTALPTSFMVFGTRFAIDSWAMSQLVFDRVRDDATGEAVTRAFPSTHDVAYVLGNDRALTHLQGELNEYNYENTLSALRQSVDDLPEMWWDEPVYNGWLNVIRSLNEPAADTRVPDVMKTNAWADKNLQTQLASWAQLRHDNLLYIKQSFTVDYPVCEFPDWYIEPNVDFYTALIAYAQSGLQLTEQLEASGLSGHYAVKQADTYFASLEAVSTILLDMVERQLNGEPSTFEDNMFIQNIIIKHDYRGLIETSGGGGPIQSEYERWDGWYTSLFYDDDDIAAVIADVHTNPTNDPLSPLYPPRVLHVGTGDVSPIFMIADKGDGPTLYVGPAFSYYEVTTQGNQYAPAERLTDEKWQGTSADSDAGYTPRYSKPAAPTWTQSFRVSPDRWKIPREVNPSDTYVLRARTTNTLWDFVFGSLEMVPGTINQPTEPSGVRVEASVGSYVGREGSYSQYVVHFTNEGTVDRTQFTAQVFVDLSELYDNGYTIQDVFVEQSRRSGLTCKSAFSGPHVWNENAHIYYVTIDLRRDSLNVGEQCQVAFDLSAVYPGNKTINYSDDGGYYASLVHTNRPTVDHTNDFSAQGLPISENYWELSPITNTTFIPIYDNNVMIGGSLPAEIPTFVDSTYVLSLPAVQLRLLELFGITLCVLTPIILIRRRLKHRHA